MFKVPKYLLLAYLFVPFLAINLAVNTDQQFIVLTQSFLGGHLNLDFSKFSLNDLSYYNGHYYWPLGPFPTIFLMPIVSLVGTNVVQGIVQFPLNVLNFILVYKICKRLKLEEGKSIIISVFYIFGSVYTPVGAISISWFYAQTVAQTLSLLAVYEFLTRRRYILLGFLIAFAILSRLSLIANSVFFLYFIFHGENFRRNLFKFMLPIAASLIVLGMYNYTRFGNMLESGYTHQIIQPNLKEQRERGLFSLSYIPKNLYFMLLAPPKFNYLGDQLKFPYVIFNPWGMSIFILSPVLILLFKTSFKDKLVKPSILTILITSIPLVTYYGIGWMQVGYRYALDFFPFLLLILGSAVKKADPRTVKILVYAGVIITWFFLIEKISGF